MDMGCPLLRLPRELRDDIFARALYIPQGLCFQFQDNGRAIFTPQLGSHTRVQDEHGVTFTFNAREGAESNQLKCTCRRLRSETLGLDLEVNELIFRGDAKRNGKNPTKAGAAHFLRFWELCNERWKQRVRRVRLHTRRQDMHVIAKHPSYVLDLKAIAKLCESYPRMTVRWHVDLICTFRRNPKYFLVEGLMCAMALREKCILKDYPALVDLQLRPTWGSANVCRGTWRTKGSNQICECGRKDCGIIIPAQNFRIIPFEKDFVEEEYRKRLWSAMERGRGHHDALEQRAELAERRVEVAKQWWKHGF